MTEPTLAQQEYTQLYEQYKYVYGLLAIMVEQEGGLVKIPRETLETYDLNTQMTLTHSDVDDTFVIEVLPNDA